MNPNSRDINENWNFFRNILTLFVSWLQYSQPKYQSKSAPPLDYTWNNKNAKKTQQKPQKSKTNSDWERFRQLRRQASKAAAKSYSDYLYNHIRESLKTNRKQFWSFIKANKWECIGIPTLQTNDQIITNDRDKANTLNNQFSSVFTKEIDPIPQLALSIYSDIPFLEIGIDGVVAIEKPKSK